MKVIFILVSLVSLVFGGVIEASNSCNDPKVINELQMVLKKETNKELSKFHIHKSIVKDSVNYCRFFVTNGDEKIRLTGYFYVAPVDKVLAGLEANYALQLIKKPEQERQKYVRVEFISDLKKTPN